MDGGTCQHTRVRFDSRLMNHVYLLITTNFILFRLGDLRYKPYGVTPEPQVRTKLLESAALEPSRVCVYPPLT
jgi:hypothetical protein